MRLTSSAFFEFFGLLDAQKRFSVDKLNKLTNFYFSLHFFSVSLDVLLNLFLQKKLLRNFVAKYVSWQ